MRKRTIGTGIALPLMLAAVGLVALSTPVFAQQSPGMQSPGGAGRQPQSVEPGTYTNEDIGYSITIPESFTGMSMPQPANVLVVSELGAGGASGQGGRQFIVGYSPEEQATEEIPDFEAGDLEEVQQMLQDSTRGAGPQTQLNIQSTARRQIAGRRGVRIRFTTTASDGRQTVHGVMYAINHRDGALVIQYFSAEGRDQLESFAERNIGTLSLE